MSINNEGSQVKISQTRPSIDLAELVKLLTSAIPLVDGTVALPADVDRKSSENIGLAKNYPLFIYDQEKQRLKICTSGVLLRLFQSPAYKKSFDAERGGFIKDYSPSRYGIMRVGGELTQGNDERLPQLVDQLSASIQEELKACLPVGFDLSNILLDDAKKQFQELSGKLKVLLKEKGDATLIPLTFAEPDLKQSDSPKKFAKMIAGTETVEVDADDYFDKFRRSAQEYLKQEYDIDSDEIGKVENCLQEEYQLPYSQIKRFFNFLQTEALSRVRLNTTFHIMSAIKERTQNYSQDIKYHLLVEYIHRIELLRDFVKEEGIVIDARAIYGGIDNIDLADYLEKTSFFYCLTVWPVCETQIFERKNTDQSVVREISYRFRINGKNPELDQLAFQVKLGQLTENLLCDDKSLPKSLIERCLAQLIFLRVVTPDGEKFDVSKDDLQKGIDRILSNLKLNPERPLKPIETILEDLKNREKSMEKIGSALIDILRDKGKAIINNADQASQQQYICIKRSLVNWESLIDAEPGTSQFLGGNLDQTKEHSYWYQNLEISATPITDNILFSIKVQTTLSQRDLVEKKDTLDSLQRNIKVERAFTDKLLQVIWVPFSNNDQQYQPSQLISNSKSRQWVLPKSIHIEYEISTLQRNTKKKSTKQHQDLHAAAVSCFTILVYVCLWQIIHQMQKSSAENSLFTTIMLRLQDKRDNTAGSGENYIYGIAQALELILGQDNPLKMQGSILDNVVNQDQKSHYVRQGVYNALMSAFPVQISTLRQPAIPKIGLISYLARPCDGNLQQGDSPKNYLFLQQSYIATAINQPFTGYHLQTERRKSDLVEEEQMKGQRLIKEEINYLKNRGCAHIILLSHSYGSRRINRINDYRPRLLEATFLEDLANIFPDLNIYPLLRDVFPATRLYKRYNEAGFEILRANDHSNLLKQDQESRLNFVPIYTFATLHAVDETSRPQSGFCIYYLVSDQMTAKIDWVERTRSPLIDYEQKSDIRPCLLTVLRGLHFIEAEKGIQNQRFLPVLDPFHWISPNTLEAIGEVPIMHNNIGISNVLLSLPALLTHVANILHRNKPK